MSGVTAASEIWRICNLIIHDFENYR
jgi:hypothetical protein